MVEPITLGAIVAALVAKSVDRAEDGVVQGGVDIARKAASTLRRWFSHESDDQGHQALERVIEVPDSPALVRGLADLLDERVEESADLRAELETLKEEAQGAGVDVASIVQNAIGDGNVQIGGVNSSQINVNPGTSR